MAKRKPSLFEDLEQALGEAVSYAKGSSKAGTRTIVLQAAKPRSAAQIRRLRQTLRLTQAELASILSVSTKAIEAWESGTRVCRGPALRLLEILERGPDFAVSVGLIERRSS